MMMNTLKLDDEQRLKLGSYFRIARNVAVISACFSVIVAVIGLANFMQLKKHDPIRSPLLEQLIEESKSPGADEGLYETIRSYDLIVRKAHFTGLAFGKFGSYLLLGSVSLFLIALKLMYELKRKLPEPGVFSEIEDRPGMTMLIQLSILSFAVLIIILSFVLGAKQPMMSIPGKVTGSSGIVSAYSEEDMKKNWTSFRGFRSLGVAHSEDAPLSWDGVTGENIIWKVPLQKPGKSSPVVWDDRIFLTGADDSAREVYCFDTESGKIIWKRDTGSKGSGVTVPEVSEDTGLAAPTMAVDGNTAAAIFATGELIAFDFDGNTVFQKNLGTPLNVYGHASSLLIHEGRLFVQYDHDGKSRLTAFNISNGKKMWNKKREVEASWSSPVLITSGMQDQLVLTAAAFIGAYDPETGDLLWRMDEVVEGEIGPSPAFYLDKLYPANQYSVLACVDVKNRKILWEFEENIPDASSPAAYNGLLILPTGYGMVSCLDADTGKLYWEHRFDTGFYSSVIINNDAVYMIDKKGVMHVVRLDKEFSLIASLRLGEACVTTPAFTPGRIFIRTEKHLYCIGNKG